MNDRDELANLIELGLSTHHKVMLYDAEKNDIAQAILNSDWLRNRDAQKWAEGFDAGERDVFEHEQHGFDTDCINNPYRSTNKQGD